jgi:hypothetical protein
MYQRRRTLFEHQEVACETLGFHWLSDAHWRQQNHGPSAPNQIQNPPWKTAFSPNRSIR